MARQGGMIQPNAMVYGLGENIGKITVWADSVEISVFTDPHDEETTVTIDPDLAPLFRMVANRLDEISGKRQRRVS